MRDEERAQGREWPRRYFGKVLTDPDLQVILESVEQKLEPEISGGIWRWDEDKHQIWKPAT